MAFSNTATRYGAVTKTFHWLTALLILSLIALGMIANDLPYDTQAQLARKAWLFSLHKTLGVTMFFVALLRILWAISQPKPGLLNAEKRLESWLAETIHWVLYAALVIVPLSGWIGHAAASGFAPIWWPFGQGLPLVPKNTDVEHAFGAVHDIGGKILIGAILLHFAGALKHHFIDRDATLRRMLPGEPVIGPMHAVHRSGAPVLTAVAVWGGAIALGLGLGFAGSSESRAAEPGTLTEVPSDWQVQTGTIAIKVMQFGSQVDGGFAEWTSSISFDETVASGKAGAVTTTISIPSLTLGSVTDQAMGPDFFDATTYPTATFTADILTAADGYVADGTLTVKDNSMPLQMPFQLAINGDAAQLRSDFTLDRRNFGIGATMSDEKSLGFDVMVRVSLDATRAR